MSVFCPFATTKTWIEEIPETVIVTLKYLASSPSADTTVYFKYGFVSLADGLHDVGEVLDKESLADC